MCGFDGRFAAFDHAGRNFPQIAIHRMAMLFDEHDRRRSWACDDDYTPDVFDDFDPAGASSARLFDLIDT